MANAQQRENLGHEQTFADELEPGSTLMQGQYTIESFLNAGGFGITYSARDSLDRRVVIKECFPGSFCRRSQALVNARSRAHQRELASIVRLFVQEAKSLAKLDHPNIVGVHQVFEENNTAYMALDFVEGRDLLDVIENPGDVIEPEQIEQILRKMLDAISFIHKQGVLHRDISPDNILINQDFEPILIDFGAAREEASKQSRVLSAMRVVKDGYSPQEFYIAGSEQGPFSDLYALAATFYHLMTGELPPNSQARLSSVASGEPDPYKPLIDRMPMYRANFLKAIDQALEILPKDRVASAESWLEIMDGTSNVVPLAPKAEKPKTEKPAKKPVPQKTMLLGGAAAAALVVVGVGISLMSSGDEAAVAQAPQAETAQPVAEATSEGVASATTQEDVAAVRTPQVTVVTRPSRAAVDPGENAFLNMLEGKTPNAEQETAEAAPVADAPQLAEVDSQNVPGMLSGWVVDLPAGLGFAGQGTEGRIHAVNGVDVTTRAEFDAAVRETTGALSTPTVEISLLSGAERDSAAEQTLTLPVRHNTIFVNGLAFETTYDQDGWMTKVTRAPEALELDFVEGDVLAGDLATNAWINERTSLPDLVARAYAEGRKSLSVAVTRDGALVPVTLPLSADTNLGSTN